MPAHRIVISGIVQGVFFRAEAKKHADTLKLTGWVKNEDDGTVSLHVEGPLPSLQAFEQWCHRGPSGARVEQVTVEEEPEEFSKVFQVRMA